MEDMVWFLVKVVFYFKKTEYSVHPTTVNCKTQNMFAERGFQTLAGWEEQQVTWEHS